MLIVAAWLAVLAGIIILTERGMRRAYRMPECCEANAVNYPGPNHYHDCTL